MTHETDHAVDLDSEAVAAVGVQSPVTGNTRSGAATLETVIVPLDAICGGPGGAEHVVMDKGYRSNAVLGDCEELGTQSYVSEPRRGRRRFESLPRLGCVRGFRALSRRIRVGWPDQFARISHATASTLGTVMPGARPTI